MRGELLGPGAMARKRRESQRQAESQGKHFKEEAEAGDSVPIPGDMSAVICSRGPWLAPAWTPASVCFGRYNKIPETGGLVNNRPLFLRDPEAGSPRSRRQQMPCLARTHFLVRNWCLSLGHPLAEGVMELCGAS